MIGLNACILFTITGFVLSSKAKLQWNIDKPFKYTGFIYTDSKIVVINPTIQIKILENEEICNFYIDKNEVVSGKSTPFRAVVKSASLGLGGLELLSNASLDRWRDKMITFSIMAEACHDPDSWSEPASVSIKVLDPPGPIWTKSSYRVSLKSNIPIDSTVIKVTAFPQKWSTPENKICQYSIRSPVKSPFQIDGEGTIRTTESLETQDTKYMTLTVVAEDCSQPAHRQSQINVFVTVNPLCKFGWTGFHKVINYNPGSGIKYLGKNPKFQLCNDKDSEDIYGVFDSSIQSCLRNKTLRLTTSVELKAKSRSLTEGSMRDQSNCKLDFESLKLQREVCGIHDSETVELLSGLNRKPTGVMVFPIQVNIFPAASIVVSQKFSFYFWMKRDPYIGGTDEYIVCQIDEAANDIFSILLRKCKLQIKLKSYVTKTQIEDDELSIPTAWTFSLPQLCDSQWHHIVILASRATETPSSTELSLFMDGEKMEDKVDSPDIFLGNPIQPISSNITDVYLGQCPKSEKTDFKGLLAGVVLTPGVLLKTSTSRCLTKCSERLYFNGMNQMNPGMSVSLNSEMQMIIINGHSVDEVIRLVKVIGFVNPIWNPKVGDRELQIETEMSCGKKMFKVSPVKIVIKVKKQSSKKPPQDTSTIINLTSRVKSILVPDSTEADSDMGTGVAIFGNTTLEVEGIPWSTSSKNYEVPLTLSRCIIKIQPVLRSSEYLDWPRHLLESVSADGYSIKITNNSRIVVLQGLHNQQVYQFLIQHLRYFSSRSVDSPGQVTRRFMLQCFSKKPEVKSNIVVVEVTIWYNTYKTAPAGTTPATDGTVDTDDYSGLWNTIFNNISVGRNYLPLHGQSNAALISEIEAPPKKTNNVVYNVLLVIGIFALLSAIVMMIKRSKRGRSHDGCLVPYVVIDKICFPLQMIKEKIKPSPSVRVELSRDFINCVSERRRDISMEMQWDDTELKSNSAFNIISNPLYEKSYADIDDMNLNKDVPPTCDEYESSTDDDTYGEFSELYLERSKGTDSGKIK